MEVTFVGHATVLIQAAGVRVLTDPVLRNRVWHLQRRGRRVQPADYADLDAVLISHLHGDHLDWPSLRRLDRQTRVLVPRGAGAMFHRQGFPNVDELSPGESLTIGAATLEATPANHPGERFRYGPAIECLGYVVQAGATVYFPGDTDLFPEMTALAGRLDVALMPVWGWGPTLGAGHLDPLRAAMALELLQPRMAIPIHWGTFHPIGLQYLRSAFLDDPPQDFARFAAERAPAVEVVILHPGERLSIGSAD